MTDERRCAVSIFIGAAGHGKSTYLRDVLNIIPKKKLVLDLAEKDFNDYAEIQSISKLAYWVKNNKRVTMRAFQPGDDFGQLFLDTVTKSVRNAVIVMEDTTGYINAKHLDKLRYLLAMRRHFNLDFFFVYHGFAFTDKEIIQFADYVTLFKTPEDYDYIRQFSKFPNKAELLSAAKEIQKNYSADIKNPNHYIHKTVRTMK